MKYKVLITTSGTGSRLGEITKTINKALVPINGRPTIEYIFDSYSNDTPFVVTLGYLGEQVREYLIKNYPNRIFEFVEVDKYIGEGSSLLYSMKCAKEKLQCPFVFHACDTLVTEQIPEPDRNWIAGYLTEAAIKEGMNLGQYRTHKVVDGEIIKLLDKGESGFQSIHIGLDGIYDYQEFWRVLEDIYVRDPNNSSLSEVHVLSRMLEQGTPFEWISYNVWLDTGNIDALKKTGKYLDGVKKTTI